MYWRVHYALGVPKTLLAKTPKNRTFSRKEVATRYPTLTLNGVYEPLIWGVDVGMNGALHRDRLRRL